MNKRYVVAAALVWVILFAYLRGHVPPEATTHLAVGCGVIALIVAGGVAMLVSSKS